MRFLYCPDCDLLQPRSWYNWTYCQRCGEKAVQIRIKIGIWGVLSYVFSFIAMIVLFANLLKIELGLGGSELYLLFGSIIAAFVCQFMEVGRAQRLAKARISEHYPKKSL